MTLGDLLDTLRQDMLHDRSDQIDGDSDKLWSDTTLIRYINEAQRRFARRSLCIWDVMTFTTVGYQELYALDKSVMSVASARFMGNGAWINGVYVAGAYDTSVPPLFVPAPAGTQLLYPDSGDLGRAGHSLLMTRDQVGKAFFDVNALDRRPPGKPLVFSTDETEVSTAGSAGAVSLRLYPIPSPAYVGPISIRVVRKPLVDLTGENLEAIPEIPEDYHLDMLDHAAYLALRIVDHELGDPARAAEFKQSFEAHVEEARVETLRKHFVPMVWGFGRNGFTYTPN